jgi:BolA family transcriptional regulator, general stress-responsive regulator
MELSARIRERLAALEPRSVELLDESERHVGHAGAAAGGSHFRLVIVSPRFSGRDKLSRHRMVFDALGPLMRSEIHALAIQALAPDEL